MFDPKLYKETFDQVQASGKTLSEVLNMANKQHHNYGRRVTRMLVIAAVISALLATTAFAYVGFTQYENPMQMLKSFFGAEEYSLIEEKTVSYQDADYAYEFKQPAIEKVPLDKTVAQQDVSPFISGIGESITSGDYTLTVEAHLYDSATDCGIIYYTLENPNGVSGYELQYSGEVWWPGGEKVIIGLGENYIIADESTDTKLSVAHYYVLMDEQKDYVEVSFGGQNLKLPFEDGGGMKGVALADGAIYLSPIAIRVKEAEILDMGNHERIENLTIRYQDGTEYVVDNNGDGTQIMNYTDTLGNEQERAYTFNRLVDLDKVEAVIINGVAYTDIQEMTDVQRADFPTYEGPTKASATEPANP